ncbi:MAG: GNAT family N-acetyltransferase [Actinomycetota bacterium]
MQVELSDDPAAFGARDWTSLVEADPEGSIFHTPAFLETWWQEFEPGGRLVIAFAEDAGATAAVCAFDVRDDLLTFLGGFDVSDYLGPVGLPGIEDRAAKALVGTVCSLEGWHRGDLAGLPADGRWLPALARAFEAAGVRVETAEDGVTPLIDLPGDFEAYEQMLSSKHRHEMRRKARRLERDAGAFRLVPTTAENLDPHLDRFIELHRSSEGPKGKFMVPGMEGFFRHLAGDLADPGPFRLTFIETAGELMAGAIAFRFKDSLSLYNSAFDHAHRALAPGMVLIAEMIRAAIDEGVGRFDLLKGDLEYKYRFGARARPVSRLLIRR